MIRSRHRGLTLAHMLAALMLLSAFSLAATYLLRATLRTSHDSNERWGRSSRFDSALGQLRRDTWNAATCETPNPQTARIESPDGAVMTWTITPTGDFVRTHTLAGATERREWLTIAAGLSFDTDGPVLLLTEPPSHRSDARRIPLVSQLALARQGARP